MTRFWPVLGLRVPAARRVLHETRNVSLVLTSHTTRRIGSGDTCIRTCVLRQATAHCADALLRHTCMLLLLRVRTCLNRCAGLQAVCHQTPFLCACMHIDIHMAPLHLTVSSVLSTILNRLNAPGTVLSRVPTS